MKKFFVKMDSFIKAIMPYTSVIAIVIGVMNLVYIKQAQDDISYVQGQVDDVKDDVKNISTDYDNSDVISTIQRAHSSIIGQIEDSEDNLKRQIIIWGN